MIELISLLLGGIARIGQHWMDLKDKQAEREHEAVMFDKQVQLQDKRFEADAALRKMDAEAAETAGDLAALTAAVEAQSREAAAAGGWVAALSASVRPILTYWHALVIYTAVKIAMLVIAMQSGQGAMQALLQTYTEADRAIMGSMLGFWFVDRSLRNAAK